MCATCGCSGGPGVVLRADHDGGHTHDAGEMGGSPGHRHAEDHDHGDGRDHDHAHGPGTNGHAHGVVAERPHVQAMDERTVVLERAVLAKNDAFADANRSSFARSGVLALNLVSSPGSGKTTLLERTIHDLGAQLPIVVIEGDQATQNDGARIRAAGARALQINTGTGCHLEAETVGRACDVLDPAAGTIVMIENVGNLVCPALFDLGERAKIVILSVTEGDDKPAKYPHMFAAADLVIFNKIDLLPYVDFDLERAAAHARALRPGLVTIALSARSGENLGAWYAWLRAALAAEAPRAASG